MLHALFHDLGKGYPGDRTETGLALSAELPRREEIHLDSRHLRGLLERRYHWNNAEIGSHFEFCREPDIYDR